jgi:hypothetical protein
MPVMSRLKSMRHRKRLCEWADLVDADLPDEIACDAVPGSSEDGQSA